MLSTISERTDLDRAHVITAFFWSGFESGVNMRRDPMLARAAYFLTLSNAMKNQDKEDPFCAGWLLGWDFELGKGE